MSKVDNLVAELESLSLDDLKEVFDRINDVLDMLGWIKLNEVKFY